MRSALKVSEKSRSELVKFDDTRSQVKSEPRNFVDRKYSAGKQPAFIQKQTGNQKLRNRFDISPEKAALMNRRQVNTPVPEQK